MRRRTISDAEDRTGTSQIVLELIVEEPKQRHKNMEQNEYRKEDLPPALVDQPQRNLLAPGVGGVALAARCADVCQRTLQALQPPALGFVTLKMAWTLPCVRWHVWMLVHVTKPIGEIKTRGMLHGLHIRINETWDVLRSY